MIPIEIKFNYAERNVNKLKKVIALAKNKDLVDYYSNRLKYFEPLLNTYRKDFEASKPNLAEWFESEFEQKDNKKDTKEDINKRYDLEKQTWQECSVLYEKELNNLRAFVKKCNIVDETIDKMVDFYIESRAGMLSSMKVTEKRRAESMMIYEIEKRETDPSFLRSEIAIMEQQLKLFSGSLSKLDTMRVKDLKENIKRRKQQLLKLEEQNNTKKKKWVVIKHKLNGNKVELPTNNPKNSGYYLCTCVHLMEKQIVNRYLQVMYYDKEKNCWSDYKTRNGLSHTILAWREDIKPCQAKDITYIGGGCFV
ncbi:MAG: hypothetical protein IJZ36_00380 [Bacilli bacterium]|nr:hypothetical protein [Bacilli bacterium]